MQTENWYAFDKPNYEVDVNVATEPGKTKIVSARMRTAKLDEEIERERRSSIEYREVNSNEEEIVVMEESANAYLFDKVATHLKGVRLKGESKEASQDWREVNETLLSMIPSSWKSTFIRGARLCSTRFIEDDTDDAVLSLDSVLPVELVIGYESDEADTENQTVKVLFEIPEPKESERVAFVDKATQFRNTRGRKKVAKIVTDLGECVRFFDGLMKRPGANVIGATFQGKTFAECSDLIAKDLFLASILPTFKQRLINTALSKYNARLQD